MKKTKHKTLSLFGVIMLNLVFLSGIIFFVSTQIQLEETSSRFVDIEGEIFYQKEHDGAFDTFVKTDGVDDAGNVRMWKIHNDIKREIGSHVSILVQSLDRNYEGYQMVEISKFKIEKQEEGFLSEE